ncbi:MAG: sigma-70 family RNA polymerase sigma factor [Coprobacillus cateniformis]|nr:sigma-70 family RNA polymerase sigma factor [Coprobacillus cateniformis]
MRKFENAARRNKTGKENRMNYIYYTAEGIKIILTPDDVGSDWIAYLHNEDDYAVNFERREKDHFQLRIDENDYSLQRNRNSHVTSEMRANQQIKTKNKKTAIPRFSDVAFDGKSYMATPEEQLREELRERERSYEVIELQTAIKTLQPQQKELIQKKFYEKRTNVDIAAEEGVTETAIRKRLMKIYDNLAKKLKK